MRPGGTFRILTVCTANQCRSPIAEVLMLHALRTRGVPWQVESAGTAATPGQPIHPRAANVLAARGCAARPGWASRQLTGAMIDEADLVLTATAANRASVAAARPSALLYTFTLLQFARLAEWVAPFAAADPLDLGQQYVDQARGARPLAPYVAAGADDIADPIGGRTRAFRRCADVIADAIAAIAAPLGTS